MRYRKKNREKKKKEDSLYKFIRTTTYRLKKQDFPNAWSKKDKAAGGATIFT